MESQGIPAPALLVLLVACSSLVFACACRSPQHGAGQEPGDAPSAASAAADDVVHGERAALAVMDGVAETYVRLVLDLGQHDPDYVDAYYGPKEWSEVAASRERTLESIDDAAERLQMDLARIDTKGLPEIVLLRDRYLTGQIASLRARAAILGGRKMKFDEESKALYDAVAPHYVEAHFEEILTKLEPLLPGDGPLRERYQAYRAQFVVPPERVDAVFRAAIDECRKRTLAHTKLPVNESFEVAYVKDKPWSAYNWYQGNSFSRIEVNVDLPIMIDRAIDLACHEGYPGHHVYNTLLEQSLVRGRGWIEYTVYPLFSPQSLIAEGTANYGIRLTFPGDERVAFERDVLFPLAGLDPSRAERYYQVLGLVDELGYAGNEAARRYLDGEIDAAEAARWLVHYALLDSGMAERRVRFFDRYRSYVINYNLGQDMVAAYIDRRVGKNGTNDDRWREFLALLSSPRLPSGLVETKER